MPRRCTGTHVPYGITQCYLPSAEVTFPPLFQPIKTGRPTGLSEPKGIQVDLVLLAIYTEVVYLPDDGHQSQY